MTAPGDGSASADVGAAAVGAEASRDDIVGSTGVVLGAVVARPL